MTDAPERIWIFIRPDSPVGVTHGTFYNLETTGAPEYIRADLHEAEVERLKAELRDMSRFAEGGRWLHKMLAEAMEKETE